MITDLLRRGADAILEAAVVPSFTRLGPQARRSLFRWSDPAPGALDGRVVVVTGGTSGLGAEIAERAAALGATVVISGRDQHRGDAVVAALTDQGGDARFVAADLSEPDEVRSLAADLRGRHDRIHAVIHNAGALLPQRRTNRDGVEVTWATMVLAPHLLTRELADRLDRAIWMSSGGMYLQSVDLDDWSWSRRPWDGSRAYAQAKRAQIDLVVESTARGEGPLQVAMHPGWADTPGVDAALPGFKKVMGPLLRSPAEGADTAVWLVASPDGLLERGAFYLDRRPRGTVRWPGTGSTDEARRRLRTLVDAQTGCTSST